MKIIGIIPHAVSRRAVLIAVLLAASFGTSEACGAGNSLTSNDQLVYIGTNTGGKSHGIYLYRFSESTGQLKSQGLVAQTDNPGFLAIAPDHRYLYAVNEVGEYKGKPTGSVSAYRIDRKTGRLRLLNVVESGGSGPTHLAIDTTGRWVLAANYGAGSVALLPVLAGGHLGTARTVLPHTGHSVDQGRQKEPHAHSVYFSPDNRFAVSADLGTDQIYVYRFDASNGTLAPNDPPYATVAPGSGPRHFAFDPKGRFAYVIQEMASTITAFAYESAGGRLTSIQTISTLPAEFKGSSTCAEIFVHPNGKFLYGSNRGHDSIAVFAIDPAKGTLTNVQYESTQGKMPRNFGIDPTGRYLIAANQDSDSLVVYHIDASTGRLTPTGQQEKTPTPICVVFVPAQ